MRAEVLRAEEEQLRRWQSKREGFVLAFLRVARALLQPCVLLAGCADRLLVLSRGHLFVVEAYDRQTEQVQVWGRLLRARAPALEAAAAVPAQFTGGEEALAAGLAEDGVPVVGAPLPVPVEVAALRQLHGGRAAGACGYV